MGLLIRPRAATYQENTGWFADLLRGGESSDSGVSINERNGIRNPTVWKCVNWRANQFGMLPKKLNEHVELFGRQSQKPASRHPLYRILHDNPNPRTTAKAFWGMVSADLHLWGNSYAWVERGSTTGRIANVWRIQPDRVSIELYKFGDDQEHDKTLIYKISTANGKSEPYFADEILHIRGLGFDGICGYSPIRLQAQTLGWNAAAQRYGAAFFKNSSRPSTLIITKTPIKDKAAKKELIENLKASREQTGRSLLVEGDTEVKSLTMPQDEAQFIETLQLQEEQICGIMGVPQHKVQILRRSTNNNIEHQGIEAVTDCLQPLCVEVEQWVNLQLLSDAPSSGVGGGSERQRYFMECELKALLRGDTAAQTAHLEKMLDRGVYSQNDALDYLGVAGFEGGDRRYINRTYVPLDRVDEIIDKRGAPAAGAATTEPGATSDNQKQAGLDPTRIFRDAVGRVICKKDRAKAVAVFEHILLSLATTAPASDFLDRYLSAMGQRASAWTDENADDAAADELKRAMEAFT